MDEQTQLELEAAAFRRLRDHLRERTDVQNIDMMNLAGFCRNCLRAEARRRAMNAKVVRFVGDDLDRGQTTDDPAPHDAVARAEGVDAVREELENLKPAEREVVRLRHLEGWSFEQIARHQDLPASTVKDRCYRALMKLKGRLRTRDVSA